MAELLEDKRFAHIGRDPRFREMKKQHHKVKIDGRFKGMFNDKRFKVKYMVDKRGRPVQTSSSDHLRRYYHLSSSDEEGTSGSEEVEEEEEGVGRRKEGKSSDKKKKDKQDHGKVKLKDADRKKKVKDMDGKKKSKTKRRNVKKNLDDESEGDECVTADVANISKVGKDAKKHQNKSGTNNSSISSSSAKSKAKRMTNKDVDTDEEGSSEVSSEEEEESSQGDETGSSGEELDQDVGKMPDYARGEGVVDSDDDSEDSDAELEIEHDWAELDKDAPEAEALTRRLAVCNMDWDRIKAVDLIVLFNSFKPPDGVIHRVTIYPSDFGLARMKEEETHGPVELVTGTKDEDDEETEYNTERLRQYQLKRLKYYYAIVECDTPETASAIYDNCDGTEYESSAAKLDLRYIPDDMTFDHEVKSVACDVPSNYTPSLFVTTALQQSNVELTWDETNKDRIAVTMRKFNKDELDEMDLRDYLASDGDDDAPDPYGDLLEAPTFGEEEEEEGEEGEEEAVRKYQALLQGIRADDRRKEDKDVEMEVSWGLGLKETTEDLVKKAQKEELTPWETYLQKRREKNRAKREQKAKAPDTTTEQTEETAAFSDDELPEGGADTDFFTDTLSGGKEDNKKTRKKKKKPTKLTAEEEAQQDEDKAELSLLMMDEDDEREHFSLKAIQEKEKMTKRRRRRKRQAEEEEAGAEDTFQMDLSDNRFEAVFTNPLYNIDPSSHEFKKTKAIEKLIDEKVKRVRRDGKNTGKSRQDRTETTNTSGEDKQQTDPLRTGSLQTNDASKLESLIKSVKVKTRLLQDKKKKKLK